MLHVQDYDVNSATQASRSSIGLYLGIILIGANLRAPITSLGPVLTDLQRDIGLDGTGAGVLNALPLLIFALLSLVAPGLGRRHGLERILGASIFAILVGTILRSLPLPGAIWVGTALLSAGIAFGNVLLPGLVKRDFPTRAAGLIGFYAAAMAGVAGIAAGLAAPVAAMPGLSWRWSIALSAVLAIVTLLAWIPQFRAKQHHLGPAIARSNSTSSPWRHPIGWQVSLFFAFHSLIFYSVVDWFAAYAASNGISNSSAGFMLLVYQVVAVTTNLGAAPLLRKSKNQVAIGLACGVLLVIGTTGLLFTPRLSIIWLALLGLGAGVAMVTSLSLFALRTQDHDGAAALSGMAQFIGYAGAATGPLLVGALHDATGGWTIPLALLVVIGILATIFAGLSGRGRTIA